jgi:signal transduction histidine kinase
MSEGQRRADDRADADRAGRGLASEIDRRLHDLALLACAALPAATCAVGWRLGPDAGSASASRGDDDGSGRRAAAALEPLGRLIASELRPADAHSASSRILDPSEMAALSAAAAASAASRAFGAIYSNGECGVCVVVAAAPEAPESEVKALLELVGNGALGEVGALQLAASRDFWRSRAARAGARDAARQRESAQTSAMLADLLKLGEPQRFRTMAERITAAIGRDRWIVALRDGDTLRIEVSSAPLRAPAAAQFSREFAESLRKGRAVLRESATSPRGNMIENQVLGDSWTAIPFEDGVLGLGGAIEPDACAKVEAMLAAAAPILRAWVAERRLGEYRALVRRMALRMYAAIDDERARIARDLHDGQGQLLAAARLALQGKPETARVIFQKLERELRTRTRGLRPATLGKLSLAAALESELSRMRESGLVAHLSMGAAVENASLPVQQLCFQVAREALTNVMRHSGASTVTVRVERANAAVRIEIADNGSGITPAPEARSSMGLAGITERLELMGGKLEVESGRSGTTLIAEIPELE